MLLPLPHLYSVIQASLHVAMAKYLFNVQNNGTHGTRHCMSEHPLMPASASTLTLSHADGSHGARPPFSINPQGCRTAASASTLACPMQMEATVPHRLSASIPRTVVLQHPVCRRITHALPLAAIQPILFLHPPSPNAAALPCMRPATKQHC